MKSQEDYDLYVEALQASSGGYSILLERDISEMFVNSYNPEWARAWNGNTDLQICLDYFAVITYITEYYTKDDTGTMTLLLKSLQDSNATTLREKMKTLMNTFIAARQMGETEAFYKIFPDFHLKDSNVTTVFIPVSKKENRSKFLMKADDDKNYYDQVKIKINGRDGLYVEKYDLISKFERSLMDDILSFSQYAKMYTPAWKENKNKNNNEDINNSDIDDSECDQEETELSKFDFVIKCFGEDHEKCKIENFTKLPRYIKINNPFPGEPPLMKKRKFPAVLRFHKFKQDKNKDEFLFSESLLYMPFKKEEELQTKIDNLDENAYKLHMDKMFCVKSKVME